MATSLGKPGVWTCGVLSSAVIVSLWESCSVRAPVPRSLELNVVLNCHLCRVLTSDLVWDVVLWVRPMGGRGLVCDPGREVGRPQLPLIFVLWTEVLGLLRSPSLRLTVWLTEVHSPGWG